MKTSLVIPSRNEAQTLPLVIERARPHVDEIIVVDDASTDETEQLIQSYDVIYLKNETNMNQEPSVERGLQAATGDILLTCDADMEHNPDDIPRLLKPLLNNTCDIVVGRREHIPRQSERNVAEYTLKNWNLADPFCGFRAFYRTVYEQVGSFYRHNYYGVDFTIQAAQKFRLNNITLTPMPRREDARIGNLAMIDERMQMIFEHIKRQYQKTSAEKSEEVFDTHNA